MATYAAIGAASANRKLIAPLLTLAKGMERLIRRDIG
jgi:hypothetical protein